MKKKILFIISCIFCTAAVFAQPGKTSFFELKDASLRQPRFIGKIDNHFLVMDTPEPGGTPVYCFDASFELVSKTYLSSIAYQGDVFADLHTARLSWLDLKTGYLTQKLVTIVDDGLHVQDKSISFKQTFRSYYALRKELDKNNRYQLYYTLQETAPDSCLFRAVLLDSGGNRVKEMVSLLNWRYEFQQDPKVLLDVKGNIHILVLDKLGTYRISSEVVINTILFDSKNMITATYPLHKVKFNDFLFSDNVKQQKIQLQGIYYDGQDKVKTGVASVQFDYERSRDIRAMLTPVPETFRTEMRKGLHHLHKRDNVLNSVYSKDIVEKNGYVLLTARVKDISEKEIRRDREWEQMQAKIAQNVRTSAANRDGRFNALLNQWLNDAQRLNTSVIRQQAADIRTPGTSAQSLPAFSNNTTTDYRDNMFAGSYEQPNNRAIGSSQRQSYDNRVEKLVYWIIDDTGYCKKYGVIDDKIFLEKDTAILQLLSYPLLQGKSYLSFSGQDPISRQGALSSILRLDKRDNENWLFPIKYKNDMVLYLPFTNDNGQYAGLYKNNKTGKFGITFIQPE